MNRYWRHPTKGRLKGRHLISADGRAYRDAVLASKLEQCGTGQLFGDTERLRVELSATPPDRRRRDLDNLLKAVLDGLGHAGVYGDDSQVDELVVIRRPARKGEGGLDVSVSVLTA